MEAAQASGVAHSKGRQWYRTRTELTLSLKLGTVPRVVSHLVVAMQFSVSLLRLRVIRLRESKVIILRGSPGETRLTPHSEVIGEPDDSIAVTSWNQGSRHKSIVSVNEAYLEILYIFYMYCS